MYFIILEPAGEGPINELVNDIVDAKKRGVQVYPVEDQSAVGRCRPRGSPGVYPPSGVVGVFHSALDVPAPPKDKGTVLRIVE